VIAWLRHHRVSLVLTLARLVQSPAATLLNVLVIGTAFALPLAGYCVLVDVRALAGSVSVEPQISVFLVAGASPRDAAAVEERIKVSPAVKGVRFVSRDSALAELKRDPAVAELAATLRDNPLPDAFVVGIADRDAATLQRLERDFRALPKVAQVQVDSAWVRRLDALLDLGRSVVSLLAALLGAALVAVTFNTIRLQILTHAEEIEVSRLVGATDAYVRRPFFYLGSVLGALGGAAAVAIVFGTLAILNRQLAPVGALYDTALVLALPAPTVVVVTLAIAAALGWVGAYLSVSRHLQPKD
jgi:cell division transport system permease protein